MEVPWEQGWVTQIEDSTSPIGKIAHPFRWLKHQGHIVVEVEPADAHQDEQKTEPGAEAGRHYVDVAVFQLQRQLGGAAGEQRPDGDSQLCETEENAQTDVIDLYQLHNVATEELLDWVLADDGAYGALDRARRAGKVGHIGITGHARPGLVKALEKGLFDTVQVPFNPIEDEAKDDVIPAARAVGAGVIGMKPVAGGALRVVVLVALPGRGPGRGPAARW
mgnify:CR=1 FL=1